MNDDRDSLAFEAWEGRQAEGWPEPYDDAYWSEPAVFSPALDRLITVLLVATLLGLVALELVIHVARAAG